MDAVCHSRQHALMVLIHNHSAGFKVSCLVVYRSMHAEGKKPEELDVHYPGQTRF